MNDLFVVLDIALCGLWILTYTLVLIGTIKYHYPLISPITQAIIAPFEWSVLFLFLKLEISITDYAFITYLYWGIVEIAIIYVILRMGYIKKKLIKPYIALIVMVTGFMVYLVTIRQHMLSFSYINTFLGVLIWAKFIRNKNYPMKGFSLAIFATKFLADFLGAIVYYGDGIWIINIVSILLPVLDFCFIIEFFLRKKSGKMN